MTIPEQAVEAAPFKWGEDYGKDLLVDLNQLAHARGTNSLLRDALQRAYVEIKRLRALPHTGQPAMTSAAKANRRADIVDRLEAENERLRAALAKAYQFISPLSDPMPVTATEMAREIMTELDIHKHGDT